MKTVSDQLLVNNYFLGLKIHSDFLLHPSYFFQYGHEVSIKLVLKSLNFNLENPGGTLLLVTGIINLRGICENVLILYIS